MYVFVLLESRYHILIAAYGRHYAQLYLRVVCRYQRKPISPAYERPAYLPSAVCAYRYVLQVGVVAAQPARYRHRLVKARMQPARFRVYQVRQGVYISALQLGKLAVGKYVFHHLVLVAQLLQHIFAGGILARLGLLLPSIYLHHFKQHFAQLLWRTYVELHTRVVVYILFCQFYIDL